ncbi:MAG: NAD(P)H-hydrate epimerase, partial [Planctomycetes bacterium]|nr:NAD(P)H-hydrate epimerase [Planctomycetota bacterium]
MLETAIALLIVKPLAEVVFSGIVGGAAQAKFKTLWTLPRKDVDDVEVALLQSALQAVIDSHKQALKERTARLTKNEKRIVTERIKEFKKTRDALRWEDPDYAKERLTEWSDRVSAKPDAPGGQFGPLVAYACTDIPAAVQDALENDFAPALRVHFHRKLRDSDVLFRIFTVEILSEFREVISWWRNLDPDRDAKLVEQVASMGEGVSVLISKVVEIERKMDDLPERITDAVLGCLKQVQLEPARLAVIVEQLPKILRLTSDLDAATQTVKDSRDLLKSYPEPQTQWVGRVVERGRLSAAWLPVRKMIYTIVGFGGQGKSALARRFTESLRRLENPDDRPLVIWWSFYLNRSADEFFDQAAKPLNIPQHDKETNRRRNSEQIAGDMIERMRTGVDGRRVLVLAGRGNNGGGGLVAARRLAAWGADVAVLLATAADAVAGVPLQQLDILRRMGVPVRQFAGTFPEHDVVIDALIGYDLQGPPRAPVNLMIAAANDSAALTVSLDVPSGVDVNTGEAPGSAIRASVTLTLALPKAGLVRPEAQQFVGELYLADISVPVALYKKMGLGSPRPFA